MPSEREQFFALSSFAIVGNTDLGPFPGEIYVELSKKLEHVYPVDLSGSRYVQGDEAFESLRLLPLRVEGVIVALPRHKVAGVIEQMIPLKIANLWIHGAESPEVLATCAQHGIKVHAGNAQLYTRAGFSFGKMMAKLFGGY